MTLHIMLSFLCWIVLCCTNLCGYCNSGPPFHLFLAYSHTLLCALLVAFLSIDQYFQVMSDFNPHTWFLHLYYNGPLPLGVQFQSNMEARLFAFDVITCQEIAPVLELILVFNLVKYPDDVILHLTCG